MGHINDFHSEIIGALRERENEVFVMARGAEADFNIPFEKRLLSLSNLKNLFRIRKILKAQRFDAIILNTNLAAFIIRLALSKRLKKTTKVINFVHGYLFSPVRGVLRRAFFLFCEMLVRGRCDTVITMNSEDFECAACHRLGGRVIPSLGVGIRERQVVTPPEDLRRRFFGGSSYVIAFVGELSRRKNQEFLIKCLPNIRRRLGDVRLCLVGDGEMLCELSALARRLSLEDAVIFTGYRPDALDFMNACDLYVSSALIEGMPLNVIEAMSIGKTVLASRIKGHVDLISDGINGYLYNPLDEDEFIDRAYRILSGGMLDPVHVVDSVKEYGRSGAVERILSIFLEEIPGL